MNETDNSPASSGIALYYLNLDRDTARRDDMEQQAREQGVELHRVPAVLGTELKPEDLTSYDEARRLRIMPNPIGAGEQGCIRSHLKAMETFLATDAAYAVIMEDDAVILPGFENNLRYLIEHTSGWGFVKLYSEPTKMFELPKNPSNAKVKLAFHKKLPWGAVAYLITRDTAKKILALFREGYWMAFDVQLAYFLLRYDIPAAGVMQNLVSTHFPFNEQSAIDDTESRRPPVNKQKRGLASRLLRYLNYRRSIWMMAYLKLRGRRTLAKALKFR